MTKLKYGDKLIYMEGIIYAIEDAAVEIEFKGRLGRLKIPKRMLISDYELKLGQELGFNMTYPEVLQSEQEDYYLDNIKNKGRQDEH